jgi:hypothetical protein
LNESGPAVRSHKGNAFPLGFWLSIQFSEPARLGTRNRRGRLKIQPALPQGDVSAPCAVKSVAGIWLKPKTSAIEWRFIAGI